MDPYVRSPAASLPHAPLPESGLAGSYVPAVEPERPAWAQRTEKWDLPQYGFFAGVAGGVLILLCAFSLALFLTAMAFFGWGSWPWVDGVQSGRADDWWVWPLGVAACGLVTGATVLLSALRVKERPDAGALAGVAMVAGGLLSFFAMGGFLLGGLLAIVGGVLAVMGSRTVVLVRAPRVQAGHL